MQHELHHCYFPHGRSRKRGGSPYALEQALAADAEASGLDVHATLDGDLVVCHSLTLDRMPNGSCPIAERE
jgi:glycerophosphoryl diester phosphodiesterase